MNILKTVILVNNFIYLALFILFRGILGQIFVFYPCLTSYNTPIIVKLMFAGIGIQSFYFIFQMIGIIKKKLIKYEEMRQKKVKLNWLVENP